MDYDRYKSFVTIYMTLYENWHGINKEIDSKLGSNKFYVIVFLCICSLYVVVCVVKFYVFSYISIV